MLKSIGAIAARPASPLAGDEFTSTDETKKYTCFVAGAWVEDTDTGFPIDYSAAPSASSEFLKAKVTGDTNYRFLVKADGTMEWGPGNAAADVTFSRAGVGISEIKSGSTVQTIRVYSGALTYAGYTGTGVNLQAAGSYTFGANISSVQFNGHATVGTNNTYDLGASGTAWRSVYFATQCLGSNGTAGAPTYSFSSAGNSDNGFYLAGNNNPAMSADGTAVSSWFFTSFELAAAITLSWSATSDPSASVDVVLQRDAADVLALRRGSNTQTFRVYNTFTDESNYEHFRIGWSGNITYLRTGNAGTGSNRTLDIGTDGPGLLAFTVGNLNRWFLDVSGHFLGGADNTYDIGASGATRARTIYVGTAVAVGTNPAAAGAIRLANNATISYRNGANSGDVDVLHVNSSNQINIGNTAGQSVMLVNTSTGLLGFFGTAPVARTSLAAPTGTVTRTTFDTTTVTLSQLAERVMAMIVDWRATGYWS